MKTNESTYRVFLVTVWQEPNGEETLAERWRFRLEDPHTQQKRVFASPLALIAALKEEAFVTSLPVQPVT